MAMFKVIQSIILDKAGKYDKFQLPFLRNYNDVIYFIGTRFNHNVIRGGIGLCHQCEICAPVMGPSVVKMIYHMRQ